MEGDRYRREQNANPSAERQRRQAEVDAYEARVAAAGPRPDAHDFEHGADFDAATAAYFAKTGKKSLRRADELTGIRTSVRTGREQRGVRGSTILTGDIPEDVRTQRPGERREDWGQRFRNWQGAGSPPPGSWRPAGAALGVDLRG
jgi:hypothetical protein